MTTLETRKEYLFTTMALFISSFIVYGCLGTLMKEEFFNNNNLLQFLFFGGVAGYGFSSILSGIILFARYISKKSLLFKIVCCCLFPLTFAIIVYVGIFCFLPYGFFNMVVFLKNRKNWQFGEGRKRRLDQTWGGCYNEKNTYMYSDNIFSSFLLLLDCFSNCHVYIR